MTDQAQDNFSEQEYLKGFNSGYVLKEKKPDLFSLITDNIKEPNDYLDGLVDGGHEFEAENMKQRYKDHIINQHKNRNDDRSR